MSLLWRERRRIGLRPDAVIVAAPARFRRAAPLMHVATCDPKPGAAPWQASIDALAAWRADEKPRRAAVSVVLSNRFCEFALIAKPDAVSSEAERAAYVRHRLQALYGDVAKDWDVQYCPADRQTLLVCCVPRALLDAVRDTLAATRAAVVSIQPYFAAAWRRRRSAVRSRSGWFVVQEPGRVVAGLLANGVWAHLAARRCGSAVDDVLDVLDRERELLPLHADIADVWLYGCETTQLAGERRGYRLDVLAPPNAAQTEIGSRGLHAMAA